MACTTAAKFSGATTERSRLVFASSGSGGCPVRDPEDVFNELGLVKFPPTLLISGALQVLVGAQRIPVDAPYLGFPPSAITSFGSCEAASLLLTVENLTIFQEMFGHRRHAPAAILLYTGGMSSPSWKRVYRLLLTSLPPEARMFHWRVLIRVDSGSQITWRIALAPRGGVSNFTPCALT